MQEQWEIALVAVAEFLQDEPQILESFRLARVMGNPEARNRLAVSIVANHGAIIERYHRKLALRIGLLSSATAYRAVH